MGHSAIFECPVGYKLEGASRITCQYNGRNNACSLIGTGYKIKKMCLCRQMVDGDATLRENQMFGDKYPRQRVVDIERA